MARAAQSKTSTSATTTIKTPPKAQDSEGGDLAAALAAFCAATGASSGPIRNALGNHPPEARLACLHGVEATMVAKANIKDPTAFGITAIRAWEPEAPGQALPVDPKRALAAMMNAQGLGVFPPEWRSRTNCQVVSQLTEAQAQALLAELQGQGVAA